MRITIFLLGLLSATPGLAQVEPAVIEQKPEQLKAPVEEKTYEMFDIQQQPQFPGGEGAMLKYLADSIAYPPLALENAISGIVVATFIIEKNGAISNVRILKDIGGECGREAARVLRSMPAWEPGRANGQPVRVRYTVPVRFRFTGK